MADKTLAELDIEDKTKNALLHDQLAAIEAKVQVSATVEDLRVGLLTLLKLLGLSRIA